MVFEGIRSLPLEWDVILRVCASSLNRVRPTAHTYPKSTGVSPRLDQRFRSRVHFISNVTVVYTVILGEFYVKGLRIHITLLGSI